MSRVAFMTFAILREPWGHPQVQGFVDRNENVFATAAASDGFIDHNRLPFNTEGDPFGKHTTGCFVTSDLADRVAETLSLWTGLEAVFAFAYGGVHAEALRRRREWFVAPVWPTYVAWWVADDHWPNWLEAHARLEHLHDHGATPFAFDFRSSFDSDGHPISLDRPRIATLRGR